MQKGSERSMGDEGATGRVHGGWKGFCEERVGEEQGVVPGRRA